jgi:hypothetical protein
LVARLDRTLPGKSRQSVHRRQGTGGRLGIFFADIAKMQYDENVTWIVELLDARVRDELEALPADMKARFRGLSS